MHYSNLLFFLICHFRITRGKCFCSFSNGLVEKCFLLCIDVECVILYAYHREEMLLKHQIIFVSSSDLHKKKIICHKLYVYY